MSVCKLIGIIDEQLLQTLCGPNVAAVFASGGSMARCAIVAPCRLPSIMASSSTDTAQIEADVAYAAPSFTKECICAILNVLNAGADF